MKATDQNIEFVICACCGEKVLKEDTEDVYGDDCCFKCVAEITPANEHSG